MDLPGHGRLREHPERAFVVAAQEGELDAPSVDADAELGDGIDDRRDPVGLASFAAELVHDGGSCVQVAHVVRRVVAPRVQRRAQSLVRSATSSKRPRRNSPTPPHACAWFAPPCSVRPLNAFAYRTAAS